MVFAFGNLFLYKTTFNLDAEEIWRKEIKFWIVKFSLTMDAGIQKNATLGLFGLWLTWPEVFFVWKKEMGDNIGMKMLF